MTKKLYFATIEVVVSAESLEEAHRFVESEALEIDGVTINISKIEHEEQIPI